MHRYFGSRGILVAVVLIYTALSALIYIQFPYDFIADEGIPFLDPPPKVIADIDNNGHNRYLLYPDDEFPNDFIGQAHKIGRFKTIFSPLWYSYYLQLPGGKALPVMRNSGTSCFFYYIHRLLFGENRSLFTLHIHIYLIGILTLLIMWYFSNSFFNRRTADLSVFLLSTSLPFLNQIFLIFFADNYIFLFYLLVILIFWKYFSTLKTRYLYLGFFVLGLAFYVKLIIIWMLVAFLVLAFWRKLKININPVVLLKAGWLTILGCLPLIIYNLDCKYATISGLINHKLLGGGLTKHNIWQIFSTIGANIESSLSFMLNEYPINSFLLVINILVLFYLFKKIDLHNVVRRRIVYMYQVSLLMFVFILITSYPGTETYYIILYNFTLIPQAAALIYLLEAKKDNNNFIKEFVTILIAGVVLVNSTIIIFYRFWPKESRGKESIALVEFLDSQKISEPVCVEFKMIGLLELLSANRIRPLHYYQMFLGLDSPDKKMDLLGKIILNNPGKRFIFRGGLKRTKKMSKPMPEFEPRLEDFIYWCNSRKIPFIINILGDGFSYFVVVQPSSKL
jgi:hypothetical protein